MATRSENQYTRKLESWGIKKDVRGTDWISVYSVKRKRSQEEGKDSDVSVHGRKYTRQEVDEKNREAHFFEDEVFQL